jgi:hypothetical protein
MVSSRIVAAVSCCYLHCAYILRKCWVDVRKSVCGDDGRVLVLFESAVSNVTLRCVMEARGRLGAPGRGRDQRSGDDEGDGQHNNSALAIYAKVKQCQQSGRNARGVGGLASSTPHASHL